jgi:hypothetical protein
MGRRSLNLLVQLLLARGMAARGQVALGLEDLLRRARSGGGLGGDLLLGRIAAAQLFLAALDGLFVLKARLRTGRQELHDVGLERFACAAGRWVWAGRQSRVDLHRGT